MEVRGEPAGERKAITALFADMAGSMTLIHDLDPEEAHRSSAVWCCVRIVPEPSIITLNAGLSPTSELSSYLLEMS